MMASHDAVPDMGMRIDAERREMQNRFSDAWFGGLGVPAATMCRRDLDMAGDALANG